MIRTGITGMDEMLGSGIPKGTRVVFSLEPGVEGRMFMMRTIASALNEKKNVCILSPHCTERVFFSESFEILEIDITNLGGKAVILDSTVRESINSCEKKGTSRKLAWKKLIEETLEQHSIDVFFVYFDLLYEDLGLQKALDLLPSGREKHRVTTVVEHLNLEGDSLISRFASENIFDLIISIHSAFTLVPFFNFFTLEYVSWARIPRRSIPYRVAGRSIRLYIPKIIITGPPASGKSTFVSHASDSGISVDRGDLDGCRTTVAMDLGWLHFRGFDITIFGTPGQPRFDPIIPQLVKNAMGIILILDATRPDMLVRAKELLHLAHAEKLPLVIAVNKSDLPHQMDDVTIREMLNLRDEIPVFFISALKRSDVHYVVESMVDRITRHPY
ncbi:MAG TPA: GTP-binding protein [Methanolinea sp.]|mgnify:FL=1|nr:GTP-binding protein [Methanolinea sp.]HQK55318.1 GTP-binding protein [Methanolinea sp.]